MPRYLICKQLSRVVQRLKGPEREPGMASSPSWPKKTQGPRVKSIPAAGIIPNLLCKKTRGSGFSCLHKHKHVSASCLCGSPPLGPLTCTDLHPGGAGWTLSPKGVEVSRFSRGDSVYSVRGVWTLLIYTLTAETEHQAKSALMLFVDVLILEEVRDVTSDVKHDWTFNMSFSLYTSAVAIEGNA